MQLPVKNVEGQTMETIEVSDLLFGVSMNRPVVHQVMVAQLANQHIGTHDTKTRAEVAGGGKKPRPQKGSGHSRQGSIRSPQWKGGGVVFGPHPVMRRLYLPRKVRRLALKCLLSQKVKDGQLVIVDKWSIPQAKTKKFKELLERLDIQGKALLVTKESEPDVTTASSNIPGIKTTPAQTLGVLDLLNYNKLVMTVDAVRRVEELWGQERPRRKNKRQAPQEAQA